MILNKEEVSGMPSNNEIELDYNYYNEQSLLVEQWINDFFGHPNVRKSQKSESLPERPDRRNSVGAIWEFVLYDEFEVSFTGNQEQFTFVIMINEIPQGYRLQANKVLETIPEIAITDKWEEEYKSKTFHPTQENVNELLKLLDEFLKYLLKAKEKIPELTYYEIAHRRVCELQGWDYKQRFARRFEQI